MTETNKTGFSVVVPVRNVVQDGVQLFQESREYPILETYIRGNHRLNGNDVYFAQTTLVVLSDTGERFYIPYMSDGFTKKRAGRVAVDIETGTPVMG